MTVSQADLHIHTTGSDGMGTPAAVLEQVARRGALAVIAITDHDDLTPALRARELHARRGYRFGFIAGMEVTTLEGHLLALFVEARVPSFRPLAATLDRIHAQGGLAIVPHPLSPLTRSIGRHGIERVLARRADGLWFDGIELANPSPAGRLTATKARRLNRERFRLAEVGGSDAHYLPAIGAAFTRFSGVTAEDLRAAILSGTTSAAFGRQVGLREIGAGQIVLQTARAMWATPSKVLGRPVARLRRAGVPAGARGS
ncbi:MAG TPA: CehA/McbA family metallohydrolase [Dehalococcoidia bacterium]|nr:CehA/McbA family metallohydrolase [Dehalococcoidia bacterium]